MTSHALGSTGCRVVAHGIAEARGEDLEGLRRSMSGLLPRKADEQTVVALVAVQHALQSPELAGLDLSGWGMAGGPCWLGVRGAAAAVHQFGRDGHRTASPHVIPNLCLHSQAATLSLAFGWQGPTFGVSGGPGHVEETLLVGLALLQTSELPGLWVVLSDGDPSGVKSRGRAVALALRPLERARSGGYLAYDSRRVGGKAAPADLNELLVFLQSSQVPKRWHAALPSGELTLFQDS